MLSILKQSLDKLLTILKSETISQSRYKSTSLLPNSSSQERDFFKNSLSWLDKFGNKEVDLYRDWLIVSDFNIVNNLSKDCLSIDNNELGKIQILKAKGLKCDRCWHYQNITVKGIENTKLCERCANIINL